MVFGGAIAIPVAYLLVLWVFKQDPLHIAPTISQAAPFLLPAEFQVEEEPRAVAKDEEDGENLDEVLDVSSGLPKPNLDPDDVGIN